VSAAGVDRAAFPGWLDSLDKRVASCGSCSTPIRWGRTKAGKKVPVDLEPVDGLYVSHFVTCPNADEHRARTRSVPEVRT
jgi:hypothetical protein